MNKKGQPVTVESVTKAVAQVKADLVMHQQALFDAIADPEELIKFFGEERALKISKALVARIKNKSKTAAKKENATGEQRKKTTDAIDEKLGKERHGYHVMNF
jgi:hypothetical protein